jgi:hypothetical protein
LSFFLAITFYARDREEEGQGWEVDFTFANFLNRVDECGAEYYYIMQDGVWYVGCPDKGSKLLELNEALATEQEAA